MLTDSVGEFNTSCLKPKWWTLQPTFVADAPRLLFEGHFERLLPNAANYDVTPDGQRFLMIKEAQTARPPQITVVLDWVTGLAKRMPAKP